jgi:hypothetical protein
MNAEQQFLSQLNQTVLRLNNTGGQVLTFFAANTGLVTLGYVGGSFITGTLPIVSTTQLAQRVNDTPTYAELVANTNDWQAKWITYTVLAGSYPGSEMLRLALQYQVTVQTAGAGVGKYIIGPGQLEPFRYGDYVQLASPSTYNQPYTYNIFTLA